jgi:hypothetical protein
MTRINIYAPADEYGDEKPALLGWFDPANAECFEQGKEWDGNNMIGVISRSEWIDEYLYRTKGGKWVRNHDAHRYMGGSDTYQFVTDAEARDWLLRSEANDEAVKRLFGDVADEEDRRAGRPEIGGAVHVRLGEALAKVDAYAAERKIKRADAVRLLAEGGLSAEMIAAMAEGDLTVRVTFSAAADGEPWCVAVEEAGGAHRSVDYGDSPGEAIAAAYERRAGVYALRSVG